MFFNADVTENERYIYSLLFLSFKNILVLDILVLLSHFSAVTLLIDFMMLYQKY